MELNQRGMSLGLFPEVLLNQELTAGSMSSVSFWEELENPPSVAQYGHSSHTHGVYPEGVSGNSQ